ncbi:V-type H+-transporting ATPase subunit d [Nematocida sp. AWRm80]|nr:V-type H+-transporting ATPase subunit d [Nematocida sp. AWRm80]
MHNEGGIISFVHGNKNKLLQTEEYKSIGLCKTLEDLKVKLQSTTYGKQLLEDHTTSLKSFRASLYKCLDHQVTRTMAFSATISRSLIDFYKEQFQLNNFIYLWTCKQEDPKLLEDTTDLHPLGIYDGLSFIKVTQGTEDTWKFCLENTSLQKYIIGLTHEILKEDPQYITNILQKRYIELLYNYCIENNLCLSEAIKFEGDKRIIEILYSTLRSSIHSKDKLALFPLCNTFSTIHLNLLLSSKNLDELKGILSTHRTFINVVGNELGLEEALRKEEIRLYKKSFYYYDDPSIVYTQLKLQELEISNLIFLAECISLGKADHIDNILETNE